MKRHDLLLLLLLGVVFFFLLRGRAAPPGASADVLVQPGPYGTRIDYASETREGGCCD